MTKQDTTERVTRRAMLRTTGLGAAALSLGPSLTAMTGFVGRSLRAAGPGPLGAPDGNGIRLPAGFSSRVVARALVRVRGVNGATGYSWHTFPDGGATFPMPDGGWVYVSNSETLSFLGGGVGAIRFRSDGQIEDAYRILGGTNANCAGGPTPWGTWLSCEEIDRGRVFECDPTGNAAARVRPALGSFQHEAAAIDPRSRIVYLTEDESDGCLYRFVPISNREDTVPNLILGWLEVAEVLVATNRVRWHRVPNPNPSILQQATRYQVAAATPFRGGEGIWYHGRNVYFTTKGDNRVWCLALDAQQLSIVYDAATAPNPILTGVDNITVSDNGKLLVAEDGGDMEIVLVDADTGAVAPLLQVLGQDGSEITGPAFSPDGTRLYFSSQRGGGFGGGNGLGITYEITGPFAAALC